MFSNPSFAISSDITATTRCPLYGSNGIFICRSFIASCIVSPVPLYVVVPASPSFELVSFFLAFDIRYVTSYLLSILSIAIPVHIARLFSS